MGIKIGSSVVYGVKLPEIVEASRGICSNSNYKCNHLDSKQGLFLGFKLEPISRTDEDNDVLYCFDIFTPDMSLFTKDCKELLGISPKIYLNISLEEGA